MPQEYDVGTRSQALALHSEGYSRAQIIEKTGYSLSGLSDLINKAKKRGYEPGKGPILREYVDNKPRKGRPVKLTPERKAKIIATLESDYVLRTLSTKEIADKINEQNPNDPPISRRSILRILTEAGFKSVKYTTKPGLKKQDLIQRVKWCLDCDTGSVRAFECCLST